MRHQYYHHRLGIKEVMSETIESGHFGRHLEFLQNENSAQPHGWFQCIPWPQKHMFRHQNLHPRANTSGVIGYTLNWQPSWTPSWISQNAQGWPRFTRQILKEDTLNYQYQLRKKLYKKILGSSKILGLATGLIVANVNLQLNIHSGDFFYSRLFNDSS